MYAIQPWGNALLVGCSIGSYATGIGMRWRESHVTLVEQRADPRYESTRHRRCLLTPHTIKLLTDLGCTEHKLRAILSPARGWRVLDANLHLQRDGSTFPSCAPGETAYHCREGHLLSILRSEFVRFGGTIHWNSRVHGAEDSNDGSGLWTVRKDYGPANALAAIITTAADTPLHQMLLHCSERNRVRYDTACGVCEVTESEKTALFGGQRALKCDVALVTSRVGVMHLWLMPGTCENMCSWRMTAVAQHEPHAGVVSFLRQVPAMSRVVHASRERMNVTCVLPRVVPAVRHTACAARVSVMGDGLIPIDPFELRGDGAHGAVEEASRVCRALYGKKYHRGDAASLLRALEQECLVRRFDLLCRDVRDFAQCTGGPLELPSGETDTAVQAIVS